jgi:hypothetical protein
MISGNLVEIYPFEGVHDICTSIEIKWLWAENDSMNRNGAVSAR